MLMIRRFGDRRRRETMLGAAVFAGAIGIVVAFAAPARAADLDYGPYDGGRYQQRPYSYPPRSQVYPVPDEAPIYEGYRRYGPAYRPQVWADPDDGYRDNRYDDRRYVPYRRPYAELQRPLPPIPQRGPYAVDPRDVPPDDMIAEEAPPRYGWRGQSRW